jgi:hypothetical protein
MSVSVEGEELPGRYEEVDVDSCRPNPWNPNEMEDEDLNRLAGEIEDVGFIDPIQVVPAVDEDGIEFNQIIGGEHRWMAMKYLGKEKIPSIVLTEERWAEGDLKKFVTVRLNALKGKLNPEKFASLWQDLASRHDPEDMEHLLAFTDDDLYEKMTSDISSQIDESGLPDQVKEEFKKKVQDEKVTVDGMADILNNLFRQYGDTMPYSFMFFEFGGKQHVKVITDDTLFKQVKGLLDATARNERDAKEMFKIALAEWNEDRIKEELPEVDTDE